MFSMGANFEDDISFEAKKNNHQSNNTIIDKSKHNLVFTFEKRKGKPVTLVGRFYLSNQDKKDILKLLKKKLACGGAIKDEWIEIQGDKKIQIKDILIQNGWRFK